MALISMTTADAVEYVSDSDPSKTIKLVPIDPEDPSKGNKAETVIEPGATVFKLRSIDVFLSSQIYDRATHVAVKQGTSDVDFHTSVNQTNVDTVRHGLIGFENFTDAKGGQVVFKTQKSVVNGRPYDVVSDETMNALGIRLIQELANKIKEVSEVSVAEEKK